MIDRTSFRVDNFDIYELDEEQQPYSSDDLEPLKIYYKTDKKGIMLFSHPNYNLSLFKKTFYCTPQIAHKILPFKKTSYHPGQLAQKILPFLNGYAKTHDCEYLKRAELYANKLIDISKPYKDGLLFPVQFDFRLHGLKHDVMIAPWYSGMAQGQALSCFIRLFKITNERRYLEVSEKIFNTFTYPKSDNSIWVAYTDERGYYWIEEYPSDSPNHTLNGFIFAIFGLYDYYSLKKDNVSKTLLLGAITTIKKFIHEYRQIGQISLYCLKHRIPEKSYHRVHIEQLDMLYRITKDNYFKSMSNAFYDDHH